MWLGDRRGAFSDWLTQQWVKATGRRVDLSVDRWLDGPTAPPTGVGGDFFKQWALGAGHEVVAAGAPRGLLPNFNALAGPAFQPEMVHPDVRRFYEETSEYELEAWSEWCGAFRPFGHVLAVLFSRRLQQLNVPLRPLDTSHGTSSAVLHIVERRTKQVLMAAWVRHLIASGSVLYAGSYSIARTPGYDGPCVRVVFPLPTGNAMVLLRPRVDAQGGLTVTSSGRGFGDPGFYFTVHRAGPRVWARYVRTMRESIYVYPTEHGDVRADHTMWLWGLVFLRLHYRLRRVSRTDGG